MPKSDLPTFLGGPSSPPTPDRQRAPLPPTMTPDYGRRQAEEVQRQVREHLDRSNGPARRDIDESYRPGPAPTVRIHK